MSAKLYCVLDPRGSLEHAGSKAPADAQQIVDELGFERIAFHRMPAMNCGLVRRGISWLFWKIEMTRAFFRIAPRSVLFIQYPYTYMQYMSGLIALLDLVKRVKVVVLVHDLPLHGEISDPENYKIPSGFKWMWHSYLIVHNEAMRLLMIANGIRESRLINLRIFDYLVSGDCGDVDPTYSNSVVFAGNLECPKAEYVSCFKNIRGVVWEVYGAPWDPDKFAGLNVHYCGSKPAGELPAYIKSGFGLIWDGPSGESCVGGYGAYLKVNDPHKLSLFLICGIPVIIWDEAAQADFVKANGIGFTISKLSEIPERLHAITPGDYYLMCANTKKLAAKIRSGAFLKAAIGEVVSR